MQKNAAWPCRAAFFPSFFSVPAAFSEFFLLVRVDSGGLMCYNLVTKFSTEVLYMADVKKGEGLVYKNHPLRRVDNLIYYGSMADKYIVMFQILGTKKEQDLNVATRVSVQLQLTDPDLRSRDRVVKKSEKDSLYAAMDVGTIWLERALAGKL